MDGDESDGQETVADGGDLGLDFGDEGDLDDGSDELDDEFDEEFDEGDGVGLDDGFDDFGDGAGGFEDGGSGGNVAELEDRVGELETEVSSVSSQVNTIREENKQIGETVNELDDTIRKLLDIYEMVTRGINPFVDDAQAMGGLDNGGTFGLFEAEEEQQDGLDPEVASADAEDFFDDDFGDRDAEESQQGAEAAAGAELAEETTTDPNEDGSADEEPMSEEHDDASSGAFEDLKAEYESGDDGWDGATDEAAGAAEPVDEAPDSVDPRDAAESDGPATDATADDPAAASARSPDRGSASGEVRTDATMFNEEDGPYLASLPASYIGELAALEWVQYLVDVGGAHGAMQAVRQYREYGWISSPVRAALDEYVMLVSEDDDAGGSELTVEHHTTSLTYVSRLAGDVTWSRGLETVNGGSLNGSGR